MAFVKYQIMESSLEQRSWHQQPLIVIALAFGVFGVGMVIGSVLGGGLALMLGVAPDELLNQVSPEAYSVTDRQALRLMNMAVHLVSFTLGTLLIARYIKGNATWQQFLHLDRKPGMYLSSRMIILMIVVLPVVYLSNWVNSVLPLPEHLLQLEDSQNAMVAAVLQMDGLGELLVAFFVAAIVPAVGEELFFRGLVQPQMQRLLGNAHLGIWLTAVLFSAIHLQFVGFLPRMLLGAVLGYLLWWSRSLWLPIIAHLLFNGIQVIAAYFYPEKLLEDTSGAPPELPSIPLMIAGVVLTGYVAWRMHQKRFVDEVDLTGMYAEGLNKDR